ncbi:succinate-semialdehyde dehydrogenase / glutarate-semialdehyde dehydrogenase [Cupriavidus metallidurans]|uniref:Succinate-semialdehyde dehydrogenase I, NADP-dependent n=1 Tax=Cupriavidus metallidurans (strain ATCC 43123 / DSM 2839 / NBRC 102507 / CH34) TaxID=266264 RepID=Q1LDH2_CUPMC|nr:NAD-dependent succinate-semialdehyde dehydrogenase [Cupriavidus metallidurans]ABF11804.1 succinate-semialdehyde dehydrogenase I, NADP-dependent [Cupriavidus metallidurans CH34]AVA37706.1 NAD-dependent succinate-semialdehyde dehydrogenase [Cupriavidus metallidurans]KWW35093.1 Glutarate-semialdehyde dehydrogenase DavD [Cupriavidus metallidurans]MDE4922274.1 NAD-dependent succinate-semialdehyde dehydrogenase [Cupriavidus metallidurans]QGS31615.1 succinate-semialdehyde dehydrogenase [Cupriavidu
MQLKDPSLFKQLAYVDGQWISADSGATFDVTDPATGEVIARVADLGAAETTRAVAAAEVAQKAWAAKTGKERANILRRWFDLMLANTDDLAYLMTREQGKPLAEAKGEIAYAASFIEWFAEEAKRVDGEVLATPAADKRLVTLRQPVGVCAAITPWNFPAAMITRKVAPALAAGCAIVIKPAELTPLSAFALAELAHRAGVPAGVLQVVTGDARNIGGVLTASPIVRKLSFTGSTEVGRILMAQSAPTIKRLSLELGGNAPFIVFDDADVDAAVEGAIVAKYRNGGQTCVCANRFYIQDGIYDAFAAKFAERTAQLRVGNGLEAGVVIGPLIEDAAIEKVNSLVEDATSKGGKVLAGGGKHPLGGTYYTPTVIGNATADMRMAREEIFGPVAPLFRFKQDDEAVAAANATEYGLAAYLYTRDISRAWRTAEALEYGMVGLNTGLISNEVAPFGGIKQSGVGREGSRHGIEEYLEIKYLCLQM